MVDTEDSRRQYKEVKKALFASNIPIDFDKPAGIAKKLAWQAKAFHAASGCETFCQFVKGNAIVITTPFFELVETIDVAEGYFGRSKKYSDLAKWCKNHGVDFLYFRFDHYDTTTHGFYKKMKQLGADVVLELPTYPYEGERAKRHRRLLSERRYVAYLVRKIHVLDEKIHIPKAKNVVDYIVTYMPYEEIWGIPVIQIDNGVDLDDVPLAVHDASGQHPFTLSCVADLSAWHGLDRVIRGIREYREAGYNEARLMIAGPDTSEMAKIKQMVDELAISDCVEFLGPLGGSALDNLFDQTDVAIGSLGLHRIGLTQGSTLKVKEYCARGVPFVYSYDEAQLAGNESFAFKTTADESAVSIESIKKFYEGISDLSGTAAEMRVFAVDHFSWGSQMRIVMDACLSVER